MIKTQKKMQEVQSELKDLGVEETKARLAISQVHYYVLRI